MKLLRAWREVLYRTDTLFHRYRPELEGLFGYRLGKRLIFETLTAYAFIFELAKG